MKSNKHKLILVLLISSILFFAFGVENIQDHVAHAEDTQNAIGEVDFPITGSNEAQQKFNRGLALLHHMMYKQAEKEFEEVVEIDSHVAMAYWGIAMTLFHPLWPGEMTKDDLEKGWKAVQQAKTLNPSTMREKAFIHAVEAFYKDWEILESET